MKIRFLRNFIFILVLLSVNIAILVDTGNLRYAAPLSPISAPAPKIRLLLIPLDSRPACSDYVAALSRIADIQVIQPPPELLDNYQTPANRIALREWLKTSAATADYAIISIDSLVHGGLLASRLSTGTPVDFQDVVQLLRQIHEETPSLQIHAFNIIPRLLAPDHLYDQSIREKILRYSILKDKTVLQPQPQEIEQLTQLEKELPPQVIEKYLELYRQNDHANHELIQLTSEGVLSNLIIGQDDGQPFGLPNVNKMRVEELLTQNPQLSEKVIGTRGTDEVAVTQLGRIVNQLSEQKLRVRVIYSHPGVPDLIMPYMPHSVAKTVEEKLFLLHCVPADNPQNSDLTLYIHIGQPGVSTPDTRHQAAQQVEKLIATGRPLALVDLSANFTRENTLLPTLIDEGVNIARLVSYSGWNTISNSIGTALTQATLFSNALHQKNSPDKILYLYETNLKFLVDRFLEDSYFQWDIFPFTNTVLRQSGVDPLQLADDQTADILIRQLVQQDANHLLRRGLRNCSIKITGNTGSRELVITALQAEVSLPWRRLFEIRLNPVLGLAELSP